MLSQSPGSFPGTPAHKTQTNKRQVCLERRVEERKRMPSRVLVHLPEPQSPILVDRPPQRPQQGDEFPPGWTTADFNLVRGEHEREEYAYELWVLPRAAS